MSLVSWCLARVVPALELNGRGQVFVRKLWPPGGLMPVSVPQSCSMSLSIPQSCSIHVFEYSPELSVSLPLQWVTTTSSLPTLQYQQVNLAQALLKSLLFSLSPGVHMTLCLASRSVGSIYASLVEFLWTSPTGIQSQILWGFLLLVLDPQGWGVWHGSLNFHFCGEKFCDIIVFQTWWIWDLTLSWLHALLPSSCGFSSLDVGYFFCRFHHFLVNGCLAVICDFGVFVKRG